MNKRHRELYQLFEELQNGKEIEEIIHIISMVIRKSRRDDCAPITEKIIERYENIYKNIGPQI